jgi:small-conductance mechanosensitive channel
MILRRIALRVASRTRVDLDELLIRRLSPPMRLLIPTIVVLFASTPMTLWGFVGELRHAGSLVLIGAVAWTLVALLDAVETFLLSKYDLGATDNLRARSKHTQLRVLTRTVQIFIIVIAAAVMLMTFPRVRELGASLLASAGLAGLVVGLAARPLLENVIAGLQIALTEPIRLDDVVIVEGEWGRIEELTTTYVVVKIWDERRLIVPLSWFLANPFQNWTRSSAQLLGTAMLYLDYRAPIGAIREELQRICKASEHWDGRVCVVQVTDTRSAEIEVRLLVSAANSGSLFNLRCQAREGIIAFLQREHPESLPTRRFEWRPGEEAGQHDAGRGTGSALAEKEGRESPGPETDAPKSS